MWTWHKQKCNTKDAANQYARVAAHKMLSKDRGKPENELAYAVIEDEKD